MPRLSASDIESIVVRSMRHHLGNREALENEDQLSDRELIERHVERIVVKPQAIEISLRDRETAGQLETRRSHDPERDDLAKSALTLPWAVPIAIATKGILHAPSSRRTMPPAARDALLMTIAKARAWNEDLVTGRATRSRRSQREKARSSYVRLLAPLAFVSPRVIEAIMDCSGPAGLTITALATALPYSWAEQGKKLGLAHD